MAVGQVITLQNNGLTLMFYSGTYTAYVKDSLDVVSTTIAVGQPSSSMNDFSAEELL